MFVTMYLHNSFTDLKFAIVKHSVVYVKNNKLKLFRDVFRLILQINLHISSLYDKLALARKPDRMD